MFPKVLLASLIIGALSVNALGVPIARSPANKPVGYAFSQMSNPPPRREPAPEPHGGDSEPMVKQETPDLMSGDLSWMRTDPSRTRYKSKREPSVPSYAELIAHFTRDIDSESFYNLVNTLSSREPEPFSFRPTNADYIEGIITLGLSNLFGGSSSTSSSTST